MTLITVPISAADAAGVRVLAEQARSSGADVVEVRLDTCARRGADPKAIRAVFRDLPLPVLATCRHAAEGGDWAGSEAERQGLLAECDRAGAAWIDCELAFDAGLRPRSAQLILSHHDFHGTGGDLPAIVARMHAAGAAIAKVAMMPRDAADLALIRGLHRQVQRPLIALAMGEYGLASRILAPVWGGFLTFARLEGDGGSAPGQPTVGDLLGLYRFRSLSSTTRVYGVIGSPVAHSLSPLIHNDAFARLGWDGVYVPFRVEDAPAFWSACGDWIDGLSITIPHKEALLPLVDEALPYVRELGIINTIHKDHGRVIGSNTDVVGLSGILNAVGDGQSLKGRTVLVLGAGGVAGAAIQAAKTSGATRIVVCNRTHERAVRLAQQTGVEVMTVEEAEALSWDILINGTSVGMKRANDPAPNETPYPAARLRSGATVIDTVYVPLETRLLREARAAGCRTFTGLDLFARQAVGQFQWWTGTVPDGLEQRMREVALQRLQPRAGSTR